MPVFVISKSEAYRRDPPDVGFLPDNRSCPGRALPPSRRGSKLIRTCRSGLTALMYCNTRVISRCHGGRKRLKIWRKSYVTLSHLLRMKVMKQQRTRKFLLVLTSRSNRKTPSESCQILPMYQHFPWKYWKFDADSEIVLNCWKKEISLRFEGAQFHRKLQNGQNEKKSIQNLTTPSNRQKREKGKIASRNTDKKTKFSNIFGKNLLSNGIFSPRCGNTDFTVIAFSSSSKSTVSEKGKKPLKKCKFNIVNNIGVKNSFVCIGE
ncbi:unnamed protein product [Nesidiocoris tenuis]|uniref:Uncharacterized protein n=1 Tax=Nesidiocoris tenuis TaxID=355587 RepID=A0A6H5GK76_9HEMI|nr:unnamed protein product [Nesidiocoris tenuis]